MKNTICAVPWQQLSTKPNGNIRICCLMSNSEDPDKGVLRRPDGSIYNARDKDFLKSSNAEKVKNLRSDLISGKENSLCKTCWEKEKIGLRSKRLTTNRLLKDSFNESYIRNNTNGDGSIKKYDILYLDLRFGNECNLKCIMCHPASSSKWYDDYVELYGSESFRDTGEKINLKKVKGKWLPINKGFYNWYESESFWHKLESKIESVKQIYLVGGEPLLIKEHLIFLKKLVANSYANKIILEYDTNLTILNDELIDIWKEFKKVKLRVSIDATKEQNNYIRFPSKWDRIHGHINKIKSIKSNIELNFSITWQVYNLFAVSNIWDLFPGMGNVRVLSSPEHLDVKILPEKLKLQAIEHFKPYLKKDPIIAQQAQSLINYLKKYMDATNEDLLVKFNNFTEKTDSIRNTSFKATFPKLYKYLIKKK